MEIQIEDTKNKLKDISHGRDILAGQLHQPYSSMFGGTRFGRGNRIRNSMKKKYVENPGFSYEEGHKSGVEYGTRSWWRSMEQACTKSYL